MQESIIQQDSVVEDIADDNKNGKHQPMNESIEDQASQEQEDEEYSEAMEEDFVEEELEDEDKAPAKKEGHIQVTDHAAVNKALDAKN